MQSITPTPFTQAELEELKSKLLAGEGQLVEQEIFRRHAQEAGGYYQELVKTLTNSVEGETVARKLMQLAGYRELKKMTVTITISGGRRVSVPSFYARKTGKKKGPLKRGPNGRGIHLLLAYWGFVNKYSPCHVAQVARTGVSSASYDLAAAELHSQGMTIRPKTVDRIVSEVGIQSQAVGTGVLVAKNETLAGKRVMISLDGGRIRARQTKVGRLKTAQKRRGFDTPWREPKLLVIAELDERGKKKRGTKSLYEATMGDPEEVFSLLTTLCDKLQLNEAQAVVSVNDGAPWVWNLFARLKATYPDVSMTGIVDFYHACEHITELTEAHTKLTSAEQKHWAQALQQLLRTGQFQAFARSIRAEAQSHGLPDLEKHLGYFETKQDFMRYDQYEAAKQPIGSGIVESAIRRVINARLKAPGTFWKLENVERLLHLRCALMAGRWDTLMSNLKAAGPLQQALA